VAPRGNAPSGIGRAAVAPPAASPNAATSAPSASSPSFAPVIFVTPADPKLDEALHDAVTAQLSGAPTPIVFRRFERDDGVLQDQVAQAQALAVAHRALGVFWVDARIQDDWLVYLLADKTGARVLVRHIRVESDGVAAATEAVAVITRESSEGLRTGQATGMRPVVLAAAVEPTPFEPPKKELPKTPAPPPLGTYTGLQMFVGYHGDELSPGVGWQSGARLAVAYRLRNGLYGGLGYTFLRDATAGPADLTFQLQRSPFDVALGFALPLGRFVPAIELRGVVEVLNRGGLSASDTYDATPGEARLLAYLGPRARLDFAFSRTVSLGLAVGLDLALNRFSFVSRDDRGDSTLLEPSAVRPVVEAGVSLWP
jgi:hypothetical protein